MNRIRLTAIEQGPVVRRRQELKGKLALPAARLVLSECAIKACRQLVATGCAPLLSAGRRLVLSASGTHSGYGAPTLRNLPESFWEAVVRLGSHLSCLDE